jgi:hypothetical protein
MLRLSARGVMGYTLLVFVVLTPVAFLLVTLLGMTRRYPLQVAGSIAGSGPQMRRESA